MENEIEVKSFKVDYQCDECGNGVMRADMRTLLSNPPQYPHKCTNCGYTQNFFVQYPYVDYKEVKNE